MFSFTLSSFFFMVLEDEDVTQAGSTHNYHSKVRFILKEINFLFSKDALCILINLKTFIMFQKMSISNKCFYSPKNP